MQVINAIPEFETALAAERPRLVRLCASLSANQDAAEDLAQETMIAAWKSRAQLASLEGLKPWAAAIARNICLSWSRRYFRELSRRAYSIEAEDESSAYELREETDLEVELDRYELARLLEQALSLLPPDTARMLVEHYIKESSHAEIADMMRVNPGTVAVRLQRGKLTLQKLMQKNLRAQRHAIDGQQHK